MLAVKKYVVPKPRCSLLSKVTQRALGTHLVPAVMKRCQVVALRLIFPYGTREETVIQIAPRRRQIELALLEQNEVSILLFLYRDARNYCTKH